MKQLTQAQRQMREATADGKFNETQVRAIAAGQAQTMTEMIVLKERVLAKIFQRSADAGAKDASGADARTH